MKHYSAMLNLQKKASQNNDINWLQSEPYNAWAIFQLMTNDLFQI
jgi:hypothetical protein